jgi:hypothetical protein
LTGFLPADTLRPKKRLLIIVTALSPTVGCRWVERQLPDTPIQGTKHVREEHDEQGRLVKQTPLYFDSQAGEYVPLEKLGSRRDRAAED